MPPPRGDRDCIAAQFPALLAEYETLLAHIGQFLKERRQAEEKKEKLPALSLWKLREQTTSALEDLQYFRSQECAERVEELLRHELPGEAEERLLQIQEQLRLYEDDQAERLLGQLLGILGREEE